MPDSNVERTLGIVLGKLESIEDRLERADASRSGIHQWLDQLVIRTTHLEADMTSVKRQTDSMRAVTDDVVQLRQQAIGAGTLGRWILRLAIGGITLGGWIAAAYTWVTGRPPP